MARPTRKELLEYAKEGLNTLIGTGSGYEYEEVLEEYEEHREWVEKALKRLDDKEKADE